MSHNHTSALMPRRGGEPRPQRKGCPVNAVPAIGVSDGRALHVPIRCQYVAGTPPDTSGHSLVALGNFYRLDSPDPTAWPGRESPRLPPPPPPITPAAHLFDPPYRGLGLACSPPAPPAGAPPVPEAVYPPLFQGLPLAAPPRRPSLVTPERRPSLGSLFQPAVLTQPLNAVQNVAWLHGPGFPDIQLPAECWTAEPDFIRPPSETLLSPIGGSFHSNLCNDPPLFPSSRGRKGSTPRGKGAASGKAFMPGKGHPPHREDSLTAPVAPLAPGNMTSGLTAVVGPMDDSWARCVVPTGMEHYREGENGAAPQGLLNFPTAMLSAELTPSPRAMLAQPEPDPALQEAERQLVAATEQCLVDSAINPFQGSLAIEKVQNIIRRQHPDLYALVVGQAHRAWNHFIQRQPTIQAFESGFGKWRLRLSSNADWEKRDEAAQAEQTAATQHLQHALVEHLSAQPNRQSTLDAFLEAYPHLMCNQLSPSSASSTPSRTESAASSEFSLSSTSDSPSEHCREAHEPDARRPSTPMKGAAAPKYPLPKRGDVARFVKRECSMFSFDSGRFMIRLLRDDVLDDLHPTAELQLPPSPTGSGAPPPVPTEC